MQKIHLDFIHPKRPAGLTGWAVLLAGFILLSLAAGVDLLSLKPDVELRQAKLDKLLAGLKALRPPPVKVDDHQLEVDWGQALAVTSELNRPWEKLFASFESLAERPVGLLSLEPDALKGDLILSGEAKNLEALTDYYRALQQQEIFPDVVLNTHQINQQDPDKPVRFRVSAKWMVKP